MSEGGVFAVARRIWEDPDFADVEFSEREAWIWLVGAAAWKPRKIRGVHKPIILSRGEFLFSIRFLARRWKWSNGRVERMLNALKKRDTIKDTSRDGEKVYLINKYNDFQIVGLPRGTVDETPSETLARQSRDSDGYKEEEGKKGRREEDTTLRVVGAEAPSKPRRKVRTSIPEDFPLQADFNWATDFWLKKGRTDLCQRIEDEAAQFRDYHTGKATESADWPASWRTWARNARDFSKRGQNGQSQPKRTATSQHLAGLASLHSDYRESDEPY